ncbi:hypothetical protein [Nordella sp. HKS 07]|uniref:hypothetical protein n=1 Tax=Nordella sp. HKS 07 TaxID=2712222 RepID=UPI001FEE5F99|nr:hypothetical protein [Nordella sp. HKS 07]
MIGVLRSFCMACLATCAIFTSAAAQDESVEMTVLADQIRSQGYECANPVSAQRQAAQSVQDEPVYILKCENATYEIRLVPDQAAKVTKVE